MGTWGAGTFANDAADELLDTLEAVPPADRKTELADLLSRGIVNGQDADPSEIVAAATLVAANLRREGTGGMGCPRAEGWLDASAADGLTALARQAIRECLPDDGGYWSSWTSSDDLAEARALVARLMERLAE